MPNAAIADQAACPPAAAVHGDLELIGPVAEELAAVGVATDAPDIACPRVEVTLSRAGNQRLLVQIHNDAGRDEARVVSAPRIAAAWIHSFTRDDIGAPLLLAHLAHLAPRPPPPLNDGPDTRDAPPKGSARTRLSIALRVESLAAADDSTWTAVGGDACAQIGPVCIGTRVRFARNAGFSHNGDRTRTDRSHSEFLAIVEAPVNVGRLAIRPRLGVGLARTLTDRHNPRRQPCATAGSSAPCDAQVPVYIGDGFAVRTNRLAIDTGIALTVPLTERLSLEVGGSLGLIPFANTEPYLPSYVTPTGEDAGTNNGLDADEVLFSLPGEPTRFWRASLGLRGRL